MNNSQPPPRGGVAGMWFLICAAVFALGMFLEFRAEDEPAFWVGAEPGAEAAIGAGAGVLAVIAGALARMVLARRRGEGK
jgi:hypothetical protein